MAAEKESDKTEVRFVLQIRKKNVLVLRFAWCSNAKLLAKISLRLQICGEGKGVELSMPMQKSLLALVRDWGPIITIASL